MEIRPPNLTVVIHSAIHALIFSAFRSSNHTVARSEKKTAAHPLSCYPPHMDEIPSNLQTALRFNLQRFRIDHLRGLGGGKPCGDIQ